MPRCSTRHPAEVRNKRPGRGDPPAASTAAPGVAGCTADAPPGEADAANPQARTGAGFPAGCTSAAWSLQIAKRLGRRSFALEAVVKFVSACSVDWRHRQEGRGNGTEWPNGEDEKRGVKWGGGSWSMAKEMKIAGQARLRRGVQSCLLHRSYSGPHSSTWVLGGEAL